MWLGALLDYRQLLGYGWDTHVEAGTPAWSHYTHTQEDEHIAFSLR